MKIFIDESVPWPMHELLSGHECWTASQRGWGGMKDGELLRVAEDEFNVFITAGQNIRSPYITQGIPILELSTNKLRRLQAAGSLIQSVVEKMQPGQVYRLQIP